MINDDENPVKKYRKFENFGDNLMGNLSILVLMVWI